MKRTLTVSIAFILIVLPGLSQLVAAANSENSQSQGTTLVANRDCKGDKDDNCR